MIYFKIPFTILLALLSVSCIPYTGSSQNIIPNGSFEQTRPFEYLDPDNAFQYLDHWYPANFYPNDSLLRGTPDFFNDQNRWPLSATFNFWNIAYKAAEGESHIGIANHVAFTGVFQPEAVATELVYPLETDEFYHIEFAYRNKAVMAFLDYTPTFCETEDNKQIDVLFGPDSLFVTINGQTNESYDNASRQLSFRDISIQTQTLGKWTSTGSCFQATGDERFIGITLTRGQFSVNPPCVIYDEHWNVFYVYYFDIDDIKLTRLPEEYRVSQEICAGRSTKINIIDLLDLPRMQNEITFHWEDGNVDSINYISKPGHYIIDAVLDCKTIPIHLEITGSNCNPNIYVPNVFSPNDDGFNDTFAPFIRVESPLSSYQFSIYDRWGAQVFFSKNKDEPWNGERNEKIMPGGVYTWILEISIEDTEFGEVHYQKTGDVTLLKN